MTGVTSGLEPHQVKELLAYSNGQPRRPERRPDNLLRRGLLMSVGKHGETKYVITEFGRAALHKHGYETARPAVGREHEDEPMRSAGRIRELEQALERAAFVAQHLHEMIDRETWRASGGDDMQGHYEGDYWAEQTWKEIESWKALAGEEPRT